jgi:hypothetical protein
MPGGPAKKKVPFGITFVGRKCANRCDGILTNFEKAHSDRGAWEVLVISEVGGDIHGIEQP